MGDTLKRDVDRIVQRFENGAQCCIIVRNEQSSQHYTTQFLEQLFSAEANGRFDTRVQVLGYVQQGFTPTPMDRIRGTKMARFAIDHIATRMEAEGTPQCVLIGIRGYKPDIT